MFITFQKLKGENYVCFYYISSLVKEKQMNCQTKSATNPLIKSKNRGIYVKINGKFRRNDVTYLETAC